MPSSPYIEVSQETRARIAEIRRRASAAEGRITGAAELFEGPNGMQFTVSIGIPEDRKSVV